MLLERSALRRDSKNSKWIFSSCREMEAREKKVELASFELSSFHLATLTIQPTHFLGPVS